GPRRAPTGNASAPLQVAASPPAPCRRASAGWPFHMGADPARVATGRAARVLPHHGPATRAPTPDARGRLLERACPDAVSRVQSPGWHSPAPFRLPRLAPVAIPPTRPVSSPSDRPSRWRGGNTV